MTELQKKALSEIYNKITEARNELDTLPPVQGKYKVDNPLRSALDWIEAITKENASIK